MSDSQLDVLNDDDLPAEAAGRLSVWYPNVALIALGATVIALAFQVLDSSDDRVAYNPWTYAVLVPVALLLTSTLLSTVVSRLVERTMQAAFLASLLVHLLVLSYASNIAIFSKAWPAALDTFAMQRQQLKRQSLQARQYVRISSVQQSRQRPDYLRPVQTEHTASQSEPQHSQSSADQVQRQSPVPSVPLQPSASATRIRRAAIEDVMPSAADEPLLRSELERSPFGEIAALEYEIQPAEAPPTPAPIAAANTLERYSSGQSGPEFSSLSPPEPQSTQPPSANPPGISNRLQKRQSSSAELSLPIPAEGHIPLANTRSVAGGQPGLAAPSSLPVYGTESLTAEVAELTPLPDSSLLQRPRASTRQVTQAPLDSGDTLRSPDWNGLPSLASGRSGQSPSRRAQALADGDAATEDISQLSGSGMAIERTALSAPGPLGTKHPSVLEPESLSHADATIQGLQASLAAVAQRSTAVDAVSRRTELDREAARSSAQSLAESHRVGAPADIPRQILPALDLSTDGSAVAIRRSSGPGFRKAESVPALTPYDSAGPLQRSDLAGPQISTTAVAMPKPAFQQRLDRLQQLDPQDETLADRQVELAIERGLAFLANHQRTDGRWRLQDFDTEVLIRSDTAATALAVLAFQGAGYTHLQSKYAVQVEKALRFLASHQQPSGDLYLPQDPASDQNAWLYSHAIASLAVCEAYGMTQDEQLRPVAQRAIDFMVSSQDRRRGGWRYRPNLGSDTSVSGWFMMALQSGRLAGLSVPQATLESLTQFTDTAQAGSQQRHLYRYNPYALDNAEQGHGLRPTAVMTSVGLLMRLYQGWNRDRREMIQGVDFLLEHAPQLGTAGKSLRDTYYWYYATQVVFHMGGQHWQKWQQTLYPLMIDHQVQEGPHAGSWSPHDPVPDLWARYGGRLYVTALNLLSLEVSYRHLPLYEATAR
ncbi:MAG: hypothetical protein KF752_19285 [Pirellulaceae bacterium]|nr:hypothetical protein [Pirellulaceae bacterium]